ncbi:glycosyltransferase [Winogradskyella eckloniae]|uniref:glycosyltransferase n=1 Tax=Winogradskyella eckloniae TaxID=1089306 RepID=UPI00156495EC|nr:glycosyltransferase [Winogradskyella eckloniae]NRD18528.1 glycosyltransferase [Winogradskyella eckloniae]
MKNKILLIGNIPGKNVNSIGGANTYTYALLKKLKSSDLIELDFIKIRFFWFKYGQVIDYIFFPFRFLFKIHKYDVISIHATWDFHLTIGPFIVFVSRLLGKKVIYHFFGGKFHKVYQSLPELIKKYLDLTILKSDYKLMETKRMIEFFKEHKRRDGFIWFPNSRDKVDSEQKTYSKKFVFISRVTPNKGIDYIIEAIDVLDGKYTVDIYGPIDRNFYNNSFDKQTFYKGVLSSDEVISTLQCYDVLVLPTFHPGEGYPGIFIEAMSVGMPIIATKWNALDELIVDEYNGKLIEIKSTSDLVNAIKFFNENNYQTLSNNSLIKFNDFDINLMSKKIIDLYLC